MLGLQFCRLKTVAGDDIITHNFFKNNCCFFFSMPKPSKRRKAMQQNVANGSLRKANEAKMRKANEAKIHGISSFFISFPLLFITYFCVFTLLFIFEHFNRFLNIFF